MDNEQMILQAIAQLTDTVTKGFQDNPCTYIHLLAEKTIDETVLQALQKKEDLAKTVVDDWRQLFSEGG